MSEHEQVKASPLGQETLYANRYDASLLYPIARDLSWEAKGVKRATLPFRGLDIWNAYEVSWLDQGGKPIVRMAEFRIPAVSPNIVESKSFKLYLNSFNLSRFDSEAQVKERMQQDLSDVAGAPVEVLLTPLTAPVEVMQLKGLCLDELPLQVEHYTPAPELLVTNGAVQEETLVSHLLKSNCPVTGQPDWASVQIRYRGAQIDHKGLLAYLISYREHGDFHEQCVENIFMDIWQRCRPQKLSVYARYVRRGGLDINPYRSSINDEPQNVRLSRQ
ncbi:NADPH-dependent 7-cyano-7-deazaguanine reductase QueF [Marinobacterium marinum]|uniref:NADPH-dependent 7-cyano-7-deazaguanine reductase n=1 Tax=Marinobacterium marinum TaxID=2756129 RepID=A0A7W2ABV7_9GAMM|nr:NADPH-dependent 7-cyano-7-deazaguanine reductase QueF [Marinobacterium marinum]MBA4501493.1 NADPH-dependent 7-cyano-7-deazaguanine reductase QueF [Marinobacterium marinum]